MGGCWRADDQRTREGCAQGKTEHTERLTILRLPLKGGAERLGASQCSFCLCHPRRGGVPGRRGCPTRPEAAPPREQVKKLDPEKTWLAAELVLGFSRAPNSQSHFHLSDPA